ncbi:flagellar basal body P-ring formation chaperone FlgA [Ramlibacter sp. H39-3-26]|uniref:flagellar basal body P-ring formation chaperone FlgA n=1 Tax=Curvibacter soli TaxID=3031331 RepID=UPI0023DC5371|nr:flagellar basal body P-ring formation chaperone FlgA [Ramlibacter sp. H39-3-26]MDF1484204.1 flagellar basal body P-ring formation chaperone FlgA [Ramlibacter sp. H39-3-26]
MKFAAGLAAALPLACVAAQPQPPQALPPAIAKALQQFLAGQAQARKLDNAAFELTLLGAAAPFEDCRSPLAVDGIDMRRMSRMRMAVACTDTGHAWRQELKVRADATADVVVAAGPIAARKAIAAADLDVASRSLDSLDDATSDIDAVAGKSSRRSLRAGQVVMARFLEASVLVKRGQAVRISVRRGGVEVDGSGEALDAGALGDVVRVRNASSGKTIQARVTGEAAVEPVDSSMPSSSQSAN